MRHHVVACYRATGTGWQGCCKGYRHYADALTTMLARLHEGWESVSLTPGDAEQEEIC